MGSRQSQFPSTAIALVLICLAAMTFCLSSSQRERELLAANTLYLVSWTCVLAVPAGIYLAVLISRTNLPLRRTFGVVIVSAMFLPLYTQTAAWQAGFGQQGWAYHWLDGWRGAIWIHAMAAIPWVTVIVGIALRHVEPQLEEAALLSGNQWSAFFHVTLRRSWFAVVAAAVWVAIITAGEFTVTDMWWLRTYAEDIFRGFAVGETPEEAAFGILPSVAAAAILLLAAMIVLMRVLCEFRMPTRAPRLFELGVWRIPHFVVALAMLTSLVGVPLFNLVMQLGLDVEQLPDETYQRSWTASHAAQMLAYSVWEFRREAGWSLVTSAAAATCVLFVAIPLAWLACEDGARKWPMAMVAAILFALPGPLLGLLLVWAFNSTNWTWLHFLYDRSILAPTLAISLRALPLAMIIVWYALRSVPQKTLDAAALGGASRWGQLIFVAMPQRVPALTAAWLMGLAIAIGDLAASFLVLPPGASPLSRRIFEEVHYGVPDRIAGITLVTMMLTSAIVLAALFLFTWSKRRRGHSAW